ncbi:MAG: hypothetical protein ACT4PZ_11275 [Panacagrimonas sp.]
MRPTVLVATTDPLIASVLGRVLENHCRSLGLRLDVCRDGREDDAQKARSYQCAEDLFDHLEQCSPVVLADTMVLLYLDPVELEGAFRPRAGTGAWHVTQAARAGVAVELLLRFPQVFPVFISLAVPASPEGAGASEFPLPMVPAEKGDAKSFAALCAEHNKAYFRTENNKIESEPVGCFNSLFAFATPLHFVSPLDRPGLEATLARFAHGMRCWFDPTGLRTLVKNRFLGTLFGNSTNWSTTDDKRSELLKRLEQVAVAIDEEREFAMFNAYAAWKYGRRAWVVTTYRDFHEHPLWFSLPAGRGKEIDDKEIDDVIVLRDVDLRFPDVPDGPDGADVRARLQDIDSAQWKKSDGTPKLADTWRARAVSGEVSVVDVDRTGANLFVGQNLRLGQKKEGEDPPDYLGLQKPVSSIYDFRLILGPKDRSAPSSVVACLRGVISGDAIAGHGAPYLNLAIAESLLEQSKRSRDSSSACIIGALLASEAYEMLLGMSKTTALEALLEMHRAEVAAEVAFPGVRSGLSIKERRHDLESTLLALYGNQESARTNEVRETYLSQFWADLRIRYRQSERFRAAEEANARSLIHTRWFLPARWSLPCLHGLKTMIVHVATRTRCLVLAALAIISVGATLYPVLAGWGVDLSEKGLTIFVGLLFDVAMSSLALQLTDGLGDLIDKGGVPLKVLAVVHLVASYILFGLMISRLYRKITRS